MSQKFVELFPVRQVTGTTRVIPSKVKKDLFLKYSVHASKKQLPLPLCGIGMTWWFLQLGEVYEVCLTHHTKELSARVRTAAPEPVRRRVRQERRAERVSPMRFRVWAPSPTR